MSVTRYLFEQLAGCVLEDGELIRHTCDEPRCCNVWMHFEVGDHTDNMRDMVTRQRSAAGERNGQARLTEQDVIDLRLNVAEHGLNHGEVSFIARGFGVTPSAIRQMLNGETWRA